MSDKITVKSCEEQTLDMLKMGKPTRGWIEDGSLSVYIRITTRFIHGKLTKTIDIANIEAKPQGKGRFTSFFKHN